MRLSLLGVLAAHVTLALSDASAQSREIILNYSDPHGTNLTLALAPHVERLSDWMQEIGVVRTVDKQDEVVIAMRSGWGAKGAVEQFTLSAPRISPKQKSIPAFEINSATGQSIEFQSGTEKPNQFKNCGNQNQPSIECRISDLAKKIVLMLAKGSSANHGGIMTLVGENKLLFDTRSTKRVIVSLDDQGNINYVDFVGLLRGEHDVLAAPDATPVNVLRMNKDGHFKIVKREQDTRVDIREVKFGFEELK